MKPAATYSTSFSLPLCVAQPPVTTNDGGRGCSGGGDEGGVGSLVLAGDLHVHDYSLFWLDVRENAQLRVRQWEAAELREA